MNYKKIASAVILILVSSFIMYIDEAGSAESNYETWRKLLEVRSSSIFTESIDLDGLRVGGRGKITFTWLDRGLIKLLEKNNNVNEAVSDGLGFYFGNKPKVADFVKNRDIFLLSYQAYKRWNFKIEEIVINGYRLTEDDILTAPFYRVLGEIPPFKERERLAEDEEELDDYRLHVAVPSLPESGRIKLSYGEDSVEWEIPKR